MKEMIRKNEFVEQLADVEELILESVNGLNHRCPVGEARRKIAGVEKNCKIIKLNPADFQQNPYIKNIEIGDWRVGNVYLNNRDFHTACETYNYDIRKRDLKSLTTLNEFCYFPKATYYPSLGTIYPYTKWMGVEPSEINTFAPFIKEAKGKVLLMGCGLGYVAYMLSLKDDVEEVTIVELNPDVKKMFEMYLKPQMNNKINIVLGDAIQFLERENLSKYQYCSVDIWHDGLDMFPIYLKCLLLEQRHPHTKFHYWLEEDLHNSFEYTWLIILRQMIYNENLGLKPGIFTEILNMQNIETVEDVRKFLTAPKRPIVKEWVLQNPEKAYNHESLPKTLAKLQK